MKTINYHAVSEGVGSAISFIEGTKLCAFLAKSNWSYAVSPILGVVLGLVVYKITEKLTPNFFENLQERKIIKSTLKLFVRIYPVAACGILALTKGGKGIFITAAVIFILTNIGNWKKHQKNFRIQSAYQTAYQTAQSDFYSANSQLEVAQKQLEEKNLSLKKWIPETYYKDDSIVDKTEQKRVEGYRKVENEILEATETLKKARMSLIRAQGPLLSIEQRTKEVISFEKVINEKQEELQSGMAEQTRIQINAEIKELRDLIRFYTECKSVVPPTS